MDKMCANNLIEPINFLKQGECLNCGEASLYLLQKDIDAISISADGGLQDNYNLYHSSRIFCSNCKSEFDYEKNGFIYTPLSANTIADRETKKQLELQRKEVQLILSTKNPFSL